MFKDKTDGCVRADAFSTLWTTRPALPLELVLEYKAYRPLLNGS